MKQPNILLLLSDQHSPRFLSDAQHGLVDTPNLDQLAKEGVSFTNAYCNAPLCVPSRMSFMTGQHCHKTGVWGNADELHGQVPTWAHALGIAGYRTVLCGRMHFVGGDQHHGFLERYVGDVSSGHLGPNRAEYRFRGFFGVGDAAKNGGAGTSHDLSYDQAVAAEAARIIRDHEVSGDSRPLCLVTSFYSPHDPYRIPRTLYEKYRSRETEWPSDLERTPQHPLMQKAYKDNDFDAVSEEEALNSRAAYRGKIEFLDQLIGGILDHWNESSLAKESIVAYTSDHGEMAGEKGLWAKFVFYESACRIPLIWCDRRELATAGTRSETAVSLVDLSASLIQTSGQTVPEWMDGTPLTNQQAQPVVLAELGSPNNGYPARMVRHDQWKLVYYHGMEGELFNLVDDPNETNNLWNDSKYESIKQNLSKELYKDGWNPEEILMHLAKRKPYQDMLKQWGKQTNPNDPIQWGLPAEW